MSILAPHTDEMKKGSSWEGVARPNPPTGWGDGATRLPHSPCARAAPAQPRPPGGAAGRAGRRSLPAPRHLSLFRSIKNVSPLRPTMITSNLPFVAGATVDPVSDGLIAESPAYRAAPRRPCSTRNRVSNLSSSRNTRSSLRDPSRLCLPCSVCHDFCSHISAEAVTMQCVDPR